MITKTLTPQIPSKLELNQYSVDADRVFAAERDRLAFQWEIAMMKLDRGVARYRESNDFDPTTKSRYDGDHEARRKSLASAREGLAVMREARAELGGILEQLKAIPAHPNKALTGDLEAFQKDQTQAMKALDATATRAEQRLDLLGQQHRRTELLDEARASGLGLNAVIDDLYQEGLVTDRDLAMIPGGTDRYLKRHTNGTDVGTAVALTRLASNRKRLAEKVPAFDFEATLASDRAAAAAPEGFFGVAVPPATDSMSLPPATEGPTLAGSPQVVTQTQRVGSFGRVFD